MAEVVIYHQNTHSHAASGWAVKTTPFRAGTAVKYYLSRFQGLIGTISNRKVKVSRVQDGRRVWVKVRTSYVLKEGESIALTPRNW